MKPDINRVKAILVTEEANVKYRHKQLEDASELAGSASKSATEAWQAHRDLKGSLAAANDMADRAAAASDAVLRCAANLREAEERQALVQRVVEAAGLGNEMRVAFMKDELNKP